MLRYDVLCDRLSDAERKGLENTFRDFIKHHCEEETLKFTRTSWLPNMQWPRPMSAHLMAVALRDEKLIRESFHSSGGWKYYFDDYLTAATAAGQADTARVLWVLDFAGIYPGILASNREILRPEISQAAKVSPSMVSTLTIFNSGPK